MQMLVHAGTGGVGQSAIQVAQSMGAAVIATAGSQSKRHLLRDMGIPAVVNSRDTDFASLLAPLGLPTLTDNSFQPFSTRNPWRPLRLAEYRHCKQDLRDAMSSDHFWTKAFNLSCMLQTFESGAF